MTTEKFDRKAVSAVLSAALETRLPLGVFTADGVEVRAGDVLNCWVDEEWGLGPCHKYVQGFKRRAYFAYMGLHNAAVLSSDLSHVMIAADITPYCSFAEPEMIISDYAGILPSRGEANGKG